MTSTHTQAESDPNFDNEERAEIPGAGRSADGRFAPDNSVRRKQARPARMRELRRALALAATPKDLVEVLRSLRDLAIGGDVRAAKGKPPRALPPELPEDPADRSGAA
jgi:hypothetical protein